MSPATHPDVAGLSLLGGQITPTATATPTAAATPTATATATATPTPTTTAIFQGQFERYTHSWD